jgi:uncharacterized protein
MSGMRIDVADLLSHPGARREVQVAAPLEELAGSAARVEAPVLADLVLDRISDGIVARGEVTATWRSECSVCLCDLEREISMHVDELFEEKNVDGETYPIEGHEIDLEQLVRDNVMLELPLAPHCDEECTPAGDLPDDPVVVQDESSTDPRWAVLSQLEL